MSKILLFPLALALPIVATATEHHPDSVRMLDLVEVSAQRFVRPSLVSKIPAPARQIPVSVTQLSLPKMREMNFTSLDEATRDIPGVNAFRDYGAFHMFFVRGFYETIVMHDGIRDDRHALWQSAPITGMSAVERIEFIKGAASMTVGHSALGGAINVVYKQPSFKRSYNARVSLGAWNTYHAQGGASGAITERLSFRTDAELKTSDGWRDNFHRVANARLALNWHIARGHKLSFVLKGNRDLYGGDYGQAHLNWDVYRYSDDQLAYRAGELPIKIDRKVSYSDPADKLAHKAWATSLRYEGELGKGWTLLGNLALSYDDVDYYSTDAISYLTGAKAKTSTPYYIKNGNTKTPIELDRIERSAFAFAYPTTSLQSQLELTTTKLWGKTRHSLLFGYNATGMKLERFDNALYDGLSYDADGVGGITSSTQPERNQGYINWDFKRRQDFVDIVNGIYAQDYISWGKLNALASLRLDFFSRDYSIHRKGSSNIFAKDTQTKINNTALTYRLGLVYNFSKAFNVYASTSNFYKPQRVTLSTEVVYLNSKGQEMDASELKHLKPVSGTQYEVGMHLDLGNQLSLNVATYHITIDNVMKSNLGTKDNRRVGGLVGRSESKGLELDLAYSPIKALDLTLAYALTDARIKEFVSNPYTQEVNAGNYIERVPKQKFTAWLFGNILHLGAGDLRLGLGVEHNGKAYTDESNAFALPSYTLMHALATYRIGKWTFQLNANNLLDATYYRLALNSTQYLPAPERNLTVSVGFDI